MGRKSTKTNKTVYQLYREEVELTREKASELMDGVSAARIEKIENETQQPTPYDIVQMSRCYKKPDLCNYYCSKCCEIGKKYIPEIRVENLSSTVLETIASLDDVSKLTGRLIQIARDGRITRDELHDFALISNKLEEVSLAIDSLNLWVEKTALEGDIDIATLNREKEEIRKK